MNGENHIFFFHQKMGRRQGQIPIGHLTSLFYFASIIKKEGGHMGLFSYFGSIKKGYDINCQYFTGIRTQIIFFFKFKTTFPHLSSTAYLDV